MRTKTGPKYYVIEVFDDDSIAAHPVSTEDGQEELAKEMAIQAGRDAYLNGFVNYFWADVQDGELKVGAFGHDLIDG